MADSIRRDGGATRRAVGSRTGAAWPSGRLAVMLACAALTACDRGPGPESVEKPAREAMEAAPAAELPEARYHTELTFVGRGRPPAVLHMRFDNWTDSTAVRLRYRGWLGGPEWIPVLDLEDSVPIPRAAWRVLPVGPLRVLVAEGGELASVILQREDGVLRLDSWGMIGSWNSSTGQRESLRLAELVDGTGGDSGLLLSRQKARRTVDPVSEDVGQVFLVADTLGNGLLLMRDSTLPDAPVTAWTWFDETEAEWADALILTLAAAAGSPGRWSIELPEAGLLGELRAVAPDSSSIEEDGSAFQIFRLEGALAMGGELWSVSGVGIQGQVP